MHSPLPVSSVNVDGRFLGLDAVQRQYRARVLERLQTGEYHLEPVSDCLCGSSATIDVANGDRFGMPIRIVACTSCGLARTSPRLASADLARFYDEDYHGLHFGAPNPDPSRALFRIGQGTRIYQYAKPWLSGADIRVAEVGCGTGQVLREFATGAAKDGRTVSVVGCEYASAYVEAGRAAGTAIEHGSAEALLQHGTFDIVILSHVVEHFPEPPRELETIRALLRPTGLAYVEVPGILAIHQKPEYDYDLVRYFTLAHTYHFSLATLAQLLWRSGLEVVSGDESVRALVRHRRPTSSAPAPTQVAELTGYLSNLESSRLIRLKRSAMRTVHRLSRSAKAALRRVVGDHGYEALRAARNRVGLRR